MRSQSLEFLRCPVTKSPLSLEAAEEHNGQVVNGALVGSNGLRYPIANGIPYLLQAKVDLDSARSRNIAYYQGVADRYDEGMEWLFRSFHQDEAHFRQQLIGLLDLVPGQRVLEVGCGTCRDSIHIAAKLGPEGRLFLQDLSDEMVLVGRKRFDEASSRANELPEVEFVVGDVCELPFPDAAFDSVFHFGGLNFFRDKKLAFQEMARVVKVGGKVVCGDEGIAPWLRNTVYGQILANSNPLYLNSPPLDTLPVNAKNPQLQWVLGNSFYVLSFEVAEGLPAVDLDLPIPGRRGGTHRTRYYGKLEGVHPEIRSTAEQAASRDGKTVSKWIEDALKSAAAKSGSKP